MPETSTQIRGPAKISPTPTVYVVDDHVAMCGSIEALLGGHGISVKCFYDPARFIDQLDNLVSGVVLLDLRMPSMSGHDVLAAMADHLARFPVIMMTGHGEIEDAVKAIKNGAKDFIQKPFRENALLHILKTEWELLTTSPASEEPQLGINSLSPRERDVVLALAMGQPNKVIAHRLNLSVRTVEMHRARAMSRLGCRTFADLLRVTFSQAGANRGAGKPPGYPASDTR